MKQYKVTDVVCKKITWCILEGAMEFIAQLLLKEFDYGGKSSDQSVA